MLSLVSIQLIFNWSEPQWGSFYDATNLKLCRLFGVIIDRFNLINLDISIETFH